MVLQCCRWARGRLRFDLVPGLPRQPFAGKDCVRAGRSREPHWHGAPCWQPHWHVDAEATDVWHPHVQLAPTQSVHAQFFVWLFMVMLQGWQTGLVWAHSANPRVRDLERMG